MPTRPLRADVTEWEDIHRAMRTVDRELGPRDVLVDDAGGAMRSHGRFMDRLPETIARLVNLNYLGTM
nr:hypothetical protein GCM10010200_002000 [Actinomadura rugatobispora]